MKIALFLLLPAVASAIFFEILDQSKDGVITEEELPQNLRKNFHHVDQNRDGKITVEEHQAFLKRGWQARLPERFQKVENLDYVGGNNVRQMLDLYLPEEKAKKPRPLLVWIHGGAWKNGSKEKIHKILPFLKRGDYAAASINYRLTAEASWPAQIHDCKAAIRYLRANAAKYHLDPERIAVIGSSAGGHLVTMLGVTGEKDGLEGKLGAHSGVTTSVRCVVDYFGPKDLVVMDDQGSTMNHRNANSPEGRLVGGDIQENLEKAKNASPFYFASKEDAPILTFHGTKDPLVPYVQSVAFEKKMEKAGQKHVFVTIEDGAHGGGFGPRVETLAQQFLDFHLLDQGALPGDQTIKAGE